jgi:hypothetical protein
MHSFFSLLKKTNALQKKNLTMRQVLSVTKAPLVPQWKQWKQLPRTLSQTEKKLDLVALFQKGNQALEAIEYCHE